MPLFFVCSLFVALAGFSEEAGEGPLPPSFSSAGESLHLEEEAPPEGLPLEAPGVSKLRLASTLAGDAALYEAWELWREAHMQKNLPAQQRALDNLIRLRHETGARAFEAFAVGLMRAATFEEDKAHAELLSQAAMQLAPDLPATYMGATGICLRHFSAQWRRCVDLSVKVVKSWQADPRYRRSIFADIGVATLFGFVATAAVVMLVFLFRSLPCLFEDFCAFFQKLGFPKWFMWLLLLGLLCLPLLLRVGMAMALLLFFWAVTLYLRHTERIFAALIVFGMSLVPTAGEWLARRTVFEGTLAEKLWLLDSGGPGTEALAQAWKESLRTSRGSFAELAALGTFELKRGDDASAIGHLRRALSLRAEEPRVMNNLGVALFLRGEAEHAKTFFERAAQKDTSLGEPLYNLSVLLQWPTLQGVQLSEWELARVSELRAAAFEKSPPLLELRPLTTPAGAVLANTFFQTVGLDSRDILNAARLESDMEQIHAQLTRMLVLNAPFPVTPWMVLVIAVVILALSFLADALDASARCALCGKIYRRKMLSMDRQACLDCTRVFLQKSAGVEPLFGFKKRLDTARFRKKRKRLVYSLSLLWPGAGLLYAGRFVSGTLYSLAFGFAVSALIYQHGFIRVPYSGMSFPFYAVPLVVIFGLIYFLSIASLLRSKDI